MTIITWLVICNDYCAKNHDFWHVNTNCMVLRGRFAPIDSHCISTGNRNPFPETIVPWQPMLEIIDKDFAIELIG